MADSIFSSPGIYPSSFTIYPSSKTRSENRGDDYIGELRDIRHKRLVICLIFVQMVPHMEWSDDLTPQVRLKSFSNQISLIGNPMQFVAESVGETTASQRSIYQF